MTKQGNTLKKDFNSESIWFPLSYVFHFVRQGKEEDLLILSNFISLNLKDTLSRTEESNIGVCF